MAFRPPLEDIRILYYRQLYEFVDFPKTFSGLLLQPAEVSSGCTDSPRSEEPDCSVSVASCAVWDDQNKSTSNAIYFAVPERNAAGLFAVFAGAEILFRQLDQWRSSMDHWGALGTVGFFDVLVMCSRCSLRQ